MGNCASGENADLPPEERALRLEMARVNKRINRELKKFGKDFRRTNRLLLLGAGESGKSTIVKQMRILHPDAAFEDWEIKEKVKDIYSNIRESICTIAFIMDRLEPPVPLANRANGYSVEYLRRIHTVQDFDYPPEFFGHVAALWMDDGIKLAFRRSHEYQLLDCAQYFFGELSRIRQVNYTPNEQDILRCRAPTCGIYETRFTHHNEDFHVFDVGGQRGEREKWVQCFNNVTAIIYVVGCSSYNQVCREDCITNRIVESLGIFRQIWNNRWLREISVIMFLNKQDILEEQIRLDPIKNYFQGYDAYRAIAQNISHEDDWADPTWGDFYIARDFIRDMFMAISLEIPEPKADDPEKKTDKRLQSSDPKTEDVRKCYPHYTTAVDTQNVMRVFYGCREIIARFLLRQFELI